MKRRGFLQALAVTGAAIALPYPAKKKTMTTLRGFGNNQAISSATNTLVSTGLAGSLLRISFGSWCWDENISYANGTKWIPNISFVDAPLTAENIALAVQHPHYAQMVMVGNEAYGVMTPQEFIQTIAVPKMQLWYSVDPYVRFALDAGGVFPKLDSNGNTIGTNDFSISQKNSWWSQVFKYFPRGELKQAIGFVSIHCYPNPKYTIAQYFELESKWLAINNPRLDIIVSEIGCPDNVVDATYNPRHVHRKAKQFGIFAWQWYSQHQGIGGTAAHYKCLQDSPNDALTAFGTQFTQITA